MRLLDDARCADGQMPETSTGALYGLITSRWKVLRPIGSFNACPPLARILQKLVRDRAGHRGLLSMAMPEIEVILGECEALLIEMYDKEESHGDYTTA